MRHEVGSRDVEVEAQRAEVFRRFELAKPLPSVDDLLAMQREFPALAVEIAGMANAKAASLMAILRGEVDDFQPDPAWRAGVTRRADAPTLRLVGRDRRAGAGDDPSEGPTTGS